MTDIDEVYSLMPTRYPDACSIAMTPTQNQTFHIIEYLARSNIIAWPNFTNCLPECGICTSFTTDPSYVMYNLFVIGFLLPFISLCGLCGNGISAFIFSRPSMRSSTNLYLCCLECSDIAVICTALIVFFVDSVRRYSLPLSIIYGVLASVAYPAGLIAQTCSVYFTLLAATDCFVRMCLPEKCRRIINRIECAWGLCCVVVVFAVLYNVPRFYENIAFECWHPRFRSSSLEVCPTPLRFNDTYLYIYYHILYTVFLAIGPLVLLIILNTCIIVASVVLKRGDTGENASLILVVLLFISCNVIALILNIFEDTLQEHLEWRINYLVDVSNLLVVFNSSFNFVIYYNFSKTFKRAFLHYFLPDKSSHKHRHSATTKSLIVENGDRNFTSNSTALLTTTTTRLNQPMAQFSYACCESPETESDINCGNCSGQATVASTSDLSSTVIVPAPKNHQNSVTKLFGLSRTEVLI
ncbi:hypothetical protein FO519_002976 [Halicephalobus sp. NKZ332]|nr:hypothetical protein FO519_002976 [Halicephalobus sp. NKZ332]